jgi:hypothetical protein
MPTPANQELYDKVKNYADKIYSKPCAYKNINTLSIYVFGSGRPFYRSGFIVKTYKDYGGEIINPRIL